MRAAYTGHEALTFSDYTDLTTGMTLRAEPGQVYDIAPASGRVVPEFPEPWFTRVVSEELASEIREGLAAAKRGETKDLGSFAEHADEPEPDGDEGDQPAS